MMILAVIVALVLSTIAYILLSPISIYISYDFDGKNLLSAGFRLYPFDYKFKTGQKKETQTKIKKKSKEATKVKKRPRKRGIDFISLIINEFDMLKDIIANMVALIFGLLKSPDRFFARVNLGGGLGEPDLTGQLYGGIEMIRPALSDSISVNYQPDFMAESLSGQATAGLVVRMGNILKQVLIFIWRLPKLRLIKIYRKMK